MPIFNSVYKSFYEWKPGANTIAYYPLNSTSQLNDMKGSGTAYNLTSSGGTITYSDNYATLDGSTHLQATISDLSGKTKVSFTGWVYYTQAGSGNSGIMIVGTNSSNKAIITAKEPSNNFVISNYGGGPSVGTSLYISMDTRYNIGLSYNGGTWRVYINGELNSNYNWSNSINNSNITTFSISGYPGGSEKLPSGTRVGGVVVQDNEMTAVDFLDYYNKTKGKFS